MSLWSPRQSTLTLGLQMTAVKFNLLKIKELYKHTMGLIVLNNLHFLITSPSILVAEFITASIFRSKIGLESIMSPKSLVLIRFLTPHFLTDKHG